MTVQVTFVCLGNICRSPMADGVMAHLVQEAGLANQISVDSCGTGGWHVGENPHRGTQKVLRDHGIAYQHHARQLTRDDLTDADYLIAMDKSNLKGIHALGASDAVVKLLMDYAPQAGTDEVPDPYYSGRFEEVYELVEAGCQGLLDEIRQKHGLEPDTD